MSSEGIEAARMDGARAHWEGFTLDDCPYERAEYVEAWNDGFKRYLELIAAEDES